MTGKENLKKIERYTKKVLKQEISPDSLPPCILCHTESKLFKPHCKRKRTFNVVVALKVIAVISWLLRFMCPTCRKTVTHYPDFALPHKHYALSSITPMAEDYIEKPEVVYDRVSLTSEGSLIKESTGQAFFGSTLHRWMRTLGTFDGLERKAIEMIQARAPQSTIARDLSNLKILKKKYRSEARKEALLNCLKLSVIEKIFKKTFRTSIFTNLARTCGFS